MKDLAARVLHEFLVRHPLMIGDARVYTHDEWKAREEPYGKNSLATLVIDSSPLYSVFNGGADHQNCAETLNAMLEVHGLYHELGFAWTIHVYKV